MWRGERKRFSDLTLAETDTRFFFKEPRAKDVPWKMFDKMYAAGI